MKKESDTKKRGELLDSLRSAKKDLCTARLRPSRGSVDMKKRHTLRRKIARISTTLSNSHTIVKDEKMVDDTSAGLFSKKPTRGK